VTVIAQAIFDRLWIGLAVPGKAAGEHRDPVYPAVPFAGQHCARPQLSGWSVQVHRALAGIFGRARPIEKTAALDIQIVETFGLEPIGNKRWRGR
jgi:hypothetical protein